MTRDADWQHRAACAGHDEPDLFFPNPGTITRDKAVQIRDAQAVCTGCPVQQQCLAEALEHGYEGVWGGLTEHQRARIRPRARQPRYGGLPTSACGTESGYRRHSRAGEKACEACRQAALLARNERKKAASA